MKAYSDLRHLFSTWQKVFSFLLFWDKSFNKPLETCSYRCFSYNVEVFWATNTLVMKKHSPLSPLWCFLVCAGRAVFLTLFSCSGDVAPVFLGCRMTQANDTEDVPVARLKLILFIYAAVALGLHRLKPHETQKKQMNIWFYFITHWTCQMKIANTTETSTYKTIASTLLCQ